MFSCIYEPVLTPEVYDTSSVLYIINTFEPLINKYAHKLNYEDAKYDLIYELLFILKKIDENELIFPNDYSFISYINLSIKHAYIKYSKKNMIYKNDIPLEIIDFGTVDDNIDNKLLINNLLKELSTHQRLIIQYVYLYGYKETDVAKMLNITRQAVNKTKKLALKKLRALYAND